MEDLLVPSSCWCWVAELLAASCRWPCSGPLAEDFLFLEGFLEDDLFLEGFLEDDLFLERSLEDLFLEDFLSQSGSSSEYSPEDEDDL